MESPVKRNTLLFFTGFLTFGVFQLPAYAKPFIFEEAAVDSIHAAFANKTRACTALVS
jgi:hypothetical protein